MFPDSRRDPSKHPDPFPEDAGTPEQSAPIRFADPIDNDNEPSVRGHPSDESLHPVLVHIIVTSNQCFRDIEAALSSTGIIFVSLDATFNVIAQELHDLQWYGEFTVTHQKNQRRVASLALSVRWSPNNRHDPQLPDSLLRGDLELTKALRMMKARGWRDHLQLHCQFNRDMDGTYPKCGETLKSTTHEQQRKAKESAEQPNKPSNDKNAETKVSTG